jgi:hypothetical protein
LIVSESFTKPAGCCRRVFIFQPRNPRNDPKEKPALILWKNPPPAGSGFCAPFVWFVYFAVEKSLFLGSFVVQFCFKK